MIEQRKASEPQLQLRSAGAHDAQPLAGLYVEAWQQLLADHHRQAPPGAARAEWLETHWRADLLTSASRAGATLAFAGDKPVGFCAWRPAVDPDSAAEIVGLYLQKDQRGRREGRFLLDAALASMRKMGYGTAVIWVWATATEVRRFFERLGFHADAERHGNELGQPMFQIRLRRPLLDGIQY